MFLVEVGGRNCRSGGTTVVDGGVKSLGNLVGDKEFAAVLHEWEEEVKGPSGRKEIQELFWARESDNMAKDTYVFMHGGGGGGGGGGGEERIEV